MRPKDSRWSSWPRRGERKRFSHWGRPTFGRLAITTSSRCDLSRKLAAEPRGNQQGAQGAPAAAGEHVLTRPMRLTTWCTERPLAGTVQTVPVGDVVPLVGSKRIDDTLETICTPRASALLTVLSATASPVQTAGP
jgi:hypothetical protein